MSEHTPDEAIFATLESEPQPRRRLSIAWGILALLLLLLIAGFGALQQKLIALPAGLVPTQHSSTPPSAELHALKSELAALKKQLLADPGASAGGLAAELDALDGEIAALSNRLDLADDEIAKLNLAEAERILSGKPATTAIVPAPTPAPATTTTSAPATAATAAPTVANSDLSVLLLIDQRFERGLALSFALDSLADAPDALLYYKERAALGEAEHLRRWHALAREVQTELPQTAEAPTGLLNKVKDSLNGLVQVKKLAPQTEAQPTPAPAQTTPRLAELVSAMQEQTERSEAQAAWLGDATRYVAARNALDELLKATLSEGE